MIVIMYLDTFQCRENNNQCKRSHLRSGNSRAFKLLAQSSKRWRMTRQVVQFFKRITSFACYLIRPLPWSMMHSFVGKQAGRLLSTSTFCQLQNTPEHRKSWQSSALNTAASYQTPFSYETIKWGKIFFLLIRNENMQLEHSQNIAWATKSSSIVQWSM